MSVIEFASGVRPVLKHGSHNQKDHGNRAGGSAREVAASDNKSAWEAVLTDEARAIDDRKAAHPERYNPSGTPDFGLKDGATEVRVVAGDGPPRVRDYETSTSAGMTMSEATQVEGFLGLGVSGYGRPLVPVGEARPPQHVYRVMSVAEFDQAQSRGYIKSDERMNLASGEGTVTSLRSTGSFYAPVDGSDYRIVRIKYDDADGWRTDSDGYIKTDERVPFDRVDVYSSPITNPSVAKHGSHNQKDHGRRGAGSDLPDGWSKRSDEDRITERMATARSDWGKNTSEERLREIATNSVRGTSEFSGPNGTTVLVRHKDAEIDAQRMNDALDAIGACQSANPVPGLTVSFDNEGFTGSVENAHGFVIRGEKKINMRPETVLAGGDGRASSAPEGHYMPSYQSTSPVKYYLTHEYGHVLDKRSNAQINDDGWAMVGEPSKALSKYGQTNDFEMYAEAFTEWSLTGGSTSNSAVTYYAEKYEWGGAMKKAADPAEEFERVVIVDTFSVDDPPRVEQPTSKSVSVAFDPGLRPVLKHGSHDQSTHGRRGGSVPGQYTAPGGGKMRQRSQAEDPKVRKPGKTWSADTDIAADEDAIARALTQGDYSGMNIGTSRLAQRLGAASARVQSRMESIAERVGLRKPVKTWTVSSEQADRMRESYYEKYGKPSWMEKVRDLLKHLGSAHDQKSHGRGGGSSSRWGDRQKDIDAMALAGPSGSSLRAAAAGAFADDDLIRQEVIGAYGEYIEEDAKESALSRLRDEGVDPDSPEFEERFNRLVEQEREYYEDSYTSLYGSEFKDQAAASLGVDVDSMNEVYGVTHAGVTPDGRYVELEARVEEVYVSTDSWEQGVFVSGSVYDGDGDYMGEFQRKFFIDDDGSLVVEHALLQIDESVQGTGFSKAFNKQAEDFYISHGVEGVDIHAALDVGGYAWAKQGFDWAPKGGATSSVKDRFDGVLSDRSLPPRLRASGEDIRRRLDLRSYDPDYPSPREVASWGYVRNAPTWPGKEVMLGSDWFGRKDLSPDGPRRSTTEAEAAANPPGAEIPGQLPLPGMVS